MRGWIKNPYKTHFVPHHKNALNRIFFFALTKSKSYITIINFLCPDISNVQIFNTAFPDQIQRYVLRSVVGGAWCCRYSVRPRRCPTESCGEWYAGECALGINWTGSNNTACLVHSSQSIESGIHSYSCHFFEGWGVGEGVEGEVCSGGPYPEFLVSQHGRPHLDCWTSSLGV